MGRYISALLSLSLFLSLEKPTKEHGSLHARVCVCTLHICMGSLRSRAEGAPFLHTHLGVIDTCQEKLSLGHGRQRQPLAGRSSTRPHTPTPRRVREL